MIKNFILILIAIFLSNSSFSLNKTDYEGHPYSSSSIIAQFLAEKNDKKKEKIIVDFINFFIAKEEEETKKKNKSDYKGETSEEFISKYFQLKKELYTSLFSNSDPSFFGRTMLHALEQELRKMFLDPTRVLTSLFNGTDKDLLYLITSYQEHFMSPTSNSAPLEKKNAAINTNNYLKAKIDYNVNIILFGLPNKRLSAIGFDYKDCQDIYNNKLAKTLTNSMVIFDLNSSKLFDSDDQKFLNLIKDQDNSKNILMSPDDFSFLITVQNTGLALDIQAAKYVHNLIHYILAEIKTQQDTKESNKYYQELMNEESNKGKKNKSLEKTPGSSANRNKAPPPKPTETEPEKKGDKSERNKRKRENRRLRNEAIKEEERAKAEAKLAEKEEQERKKIAAEKEEQERKKIAAEKEEQERKKIAVEKEEQEPKRIVAEQELKPQSVVADSTKRKKRKKRRKKNIKQESFALVTNTDGSENLVSLGESVGSNIGYNFAKPEEGNLDLFKLGASSCGGAILANIEVLENQYKFSDIAQSNDTDKSFITSILAAKMRTVEIMLGLQSISSLADAEEIHLELSSINIMIRGCMGNLHNFIFGLEQTILVPMISPGVNFIDSENTGYYDTKGTWHPFR